MLAIRPGAYAGAVPAPRRAAPALAALLAGLAACGGSPAPRPRHAGGAPTRRHRAAAPLPRAPADVRGALARRMPVPILMYHVVSAAPAGTPNPDLWVGAATFAAQMRALRR